MVSSKKSKISKKVGVSIIIPVYNSEGWIGRTLSGIEKSLKKSRFDAEIIVVDDGSTDGSVAEIKQFQKKYKGSFLCIEQENKGRYVARKTGIEASTKDSILFIDSRIDVGEQSLKFLSEQLDVDTDQVWNGHVDVDKKGNIFARFWDAIVCIAWRRYFKKPRRTSFGIKDFDHYPKGTGFFFVPKHRLVAAMNHFEKNSNDLKFSSDDTLLIRYLAERQPINLSPEFSCVYHGRSTFKGFLKHAYNRGQFFVDGFLRKGTRFFYPLIAVLVASVVGAVALVVSFDPVIFWLIGLLLLFAVGLFVGGKVFGVHTKDAASLALLGIPFALVYLAGIWRGVTRKVKPQLMRKRIFLSGSIGEYIAVAGVYLGWLALITKGTMLNLADRIFSGVGDGTAGFMWLNFADPGVDPLLSPTDIVNYPYGEALGGASMVTYYAIWLPLRFFSSLFGQVAGLNIVMILGFMGAALSSYWLVKRLTGNVYAAFFAGFATAFVPYAINKSSAHLAYIFSGVFVLMLAAFIEFWKKPGFRVSLLLALAIALAFYTDGYFVLLATVMTLSMVVGGFIYLALKRASLDLAVVRIKWLFATLGLLIVFLSPIAAVQLFQGDEVRSNLASSRPGTIEQEIRAYRSNVMDFIVPPESVVFHGDIESLKEMNAYKNLRSNSGESMNYIAPVIMFLVAFGGAILIAYVFFRKNLSIRVDDKKMSDFLLVACLVVVSCTVFLMFMFSPEVYIGNFKLTLPGQIFISYDLNMWRVMSRFFVPFNALISVFAGLALYMLYSYIAPANKGRRKIVGGLTAIAVTVLCIVQYTVDIPNRPFVFSQDIPEAYEWLRDQRDVDVIAELPFVDPLDHRTAQYVTYQMVHGKKLVNTKEPYVERVNSSVGGGVDALDFAISRGAELIVLRQKNCTFKEWGGLVHESKSGAPNVMVCLYKPYQRKSSDGVFAVLSSDFRSIIDKDNKSDIRMESTKGKIFITDRSLETPYRSDVNLSMNISINPSIDASWKIVRAGKVLQKGRGSGRVDVDTKGSESVSLIIDVHSGSVDKEYAILSNLLVHAIN